jgi:hypothetical protein
MKIRSRDVHRKAQSQTDRQKFQAGLKFHFFLVIGLQLSMQMEGTKTKL